MIQGKAPEKPDPVVWAETLWNCPFSSEKRPLRLNSFQKQMLALQHDYDHVLCSSHRRSGKSLAIALAALYHALVEREDVLILSPSQALSQELFRKVRLLLTTNPLWYVALAIDKNSPQALVFKHGGRIQGLSTDTKLPPCGLQPDRVLIEEGDWFDPDAWAKVCPLAVGLPTLLVTTPSPQTNTLLKRSLKFRQEHPDRVPKWKLYQHSILDNQDLSLAYVQDAFEMSEEETWSQEYLLEYPGTPT